MKRIKKMKNNTYSNDKDSIIEKQKTVETPFFFRKREKISTTTFLKRRYRKDDPLFAGGSIRICILSPYIYMQGSYTIV